MGIRQDQCNKVCRIIDDYLANRPRERDELIVAVRTVFKEADSKDEPQKKEVEWVYNKRERLWYPYLNGELLFKDEPNSSEKPNNLSEIPTGLERSSE